MLNDQKDKLCNNVEGFQLSQPIPNPSRDRSEQPVVITDRSGQPVVDTSKTHIRSSDDSKSLNVELAHDRSEQPVVETNTANVPDGCQTRSCHESISFNVGDETLCDRSGQPVLNRDESSHEQTMLNEVNTFCCEACAEHKRSRIDSEN